MELVEGLAAVDDVDTFIDDLTAIGDAHDVTVQAFDARYVVGRTHLDRALRLATRAAERDEKIARDRAVEILLYAAGRRQIHEALEMGLGDGTTPAVILIDAETGDADAEAAATAEVRDLLEPADTLGDYDRDRVTEYFGVTDAELAATAGTLADAVRERGALLVVER